MSVTSTIISTLVAKLTLDAAGFNTNIDTATEKANKLIGALSALGITKGVEKAVNSAMDFETAFTGVTKTVEAAGETAEEQAQYYADLRQEILNMSTELPSTATEIAGVYQAAGQLGISADNLTDFSRSMIMMASATNLSSDQAATTLARFANITKMDQTEFSNLGSSIVMLGNNMATTESEVAEYSQRLALMGTSMGMSEADIVAFGATISSLGLESASSATALVRFTNQVTGAVANFSGESSENIETFSKIASMSKEELDALSESTGLSVDQLKHLGDDYADSADTLQVLAETANMTAEEFAAAWGEDATGAFQAFLEGLGQLNSADQGNVMTDLGIEQINEIQTLESLASGSDLLASALTMSNTAWEQNTALTNEANTANSTTAAQIQLMKNNVDELAIVLGQTLLPIISQLADDIAPVIQSISEWTQKHPELTSGIMYTVGAISLLGSIMSAVLPIISLFGTAGIAAAAPYLSMALAFGAISGLVALFVTDMQRARIEADETYQHLNNLSEETQELTREAIQGLMEQEYSYEGVENYLNSNGEWVQAEMGMVIPVRWDMDSGSYVSLQEDIDAYIAEHSVEIPAELDIPESGVSESIEDTTDQVTSSGEQAQSIIDGLNETINSFTANTEQFGEAMNGDLSESIGTFQSFVDSAAFQQFANQPVSEDVGASWESFGESVTSASTGFQTLTQTLLGEEGADPEATPLAMALQTISDKVRSVYGESKRLAEYWQDTFPSSVQTMLAVLCVTSTDEEGNVNAGGGNTLVTALGVVFDLFGDILTTSQQLAGFWTTEFVAASITMRNEAGPTGKAVMKLGAFASGAADQFYNMAAAILAVVDAMALLKGVKIGGSSGGSSGGGKKGGGKLKGNRDMTRASGGPVSDGLTYLVGENGPELFTPSRNGYIVPNEELSASRESITVNIGGNIYGESYLQNYVVETLTTAIRQELKTAA